MKRLLFALALAIPAAGQTYIIAGVVTDVAHNQPLERARVTLFGPRAFKTAVTTGTDGRFLFEVPAGKYNLYAEHNDWRVQFGNPEPLGGFGSAIITGPSQDTAHLVFRWHAPGAIFGTVVDDQGEPVREANVQLIRDGISVGRRRVLPAGTTTTDDRGQYRFGPVAAGNYYVVASGRPGDAMQLAGMISGATNGQPPSVYPPTYFPGVTDSRDAAILAVKSGGEIRADIPLRATPGAIVRIHCPGSGINDDSCPGMPAFALHGVAGVELSAPVITTDFRNGSLGVAPGRYTVRAGGGGKAASKVIDVGSGESTFNLDLESAAVITGTVTYKNPLPARAHEYIAIDNEIAGGRGFGALLPEDGAFTFHVGGSRYRPRLYGAVPMFIAGLSADGVPIKDGVVDATEKNPVYIDILASDEMGNLKGFAMNGDQPVPAVLAPAKDSPNPTDYRGYQTEYDGSFDYAAVKAGDYLLFAVDRLELEYTNPQAIRSYLQSATPVRVAPHAVVEQNIAVAATKRN